MAGLEHEKSCGFSYVPVVVWRVWKGGEKGIVVASSHAAAVLQKYRTWYVMGVALEEESQALSAPWKHYEGGERQHVKHPPHTVLVVTLTKYFYFYAELI